jgi:CBS domain-containing protein
MTPQGRHTPVVRDVMTPDPMVVHAEDEAEPLLGLFGQQDFNAVPVVDAEGDLIGVVTKLSMLRLFRRVGSSRTADPVGSSSVRVRDVMDTRAVWVEPAESLDAVVRQMTRHHARSVPVVERARSRRRLVGMVSRGDLLRGFARAAASNMAPGGGR